MTSHLFGHASSG